jgi:hypothetical protein
MTAGHFAGLGAVLPCMFCLIAKGEPRAWFAAQNGV